MRLNFFLMEGCDIALTHLLCEELCWNRLGYPTPTKIASWGVHLARQSAEILVVYNTQVSFFLSIFQPVTSHYFWFGHLEEWTNKKTHTQRVKSIMFRGKQLEPLALLLSILHLCVTLAYYRHKSCHYKILGMHRLQIFPKGHNNQERWRGHSDPGYNHLLSSATPPASLGPQYLWTSTCSDFLDLVTDQLPFSQANQYKNNNLPLKKKKAQSAIKKCNKRDKTDSAEVPEISQEGMEQTPAAKSLLWNWNCTLHFNGLIKRTQRKPTESRFCHYWPYVRLVACAHLDASSSEAQH